MRKLKNRKERGHPVLLLHWAAFYPTLGDSRLGTSSACPVLTDDPGEAAKLSFPLAVIRVTTGVSSSHTDGQEPPPLFASQDKHLPPPPDTPQQKPEPSLLPVVSSKKYGLLITNPASFPWGCDHYSGSRQEMPDASEQEETCPDVQEENPGWCLRLLSLKTGLSGDPQIPLDPVSRVRWGRQRLRMGLQRLRQL